MKVTIRNYSKKSRSKKAMDDLKEFTLITAKLMGVDKHIKHFRLEYRDRWFGYYTKTKGPLSGFKFLFDKGQARLMFVAYYDMNQVERKAWIVHEMTHIRQMVSGDLKIRKNNTEAIWKGKINHSWKKFRFKKMDSYKSSYGMNRYIRSVFPWEVEVQENTTPTRRAERNK